MEETWKDIPGYEGMFQASNLGNIKRLNYRNSGKEKILVKYLRKNNYYYVCLYKDRYSKHIKVSQLIAMTYLNHKPCGMKKVVNHIDLIKTNDVLENLEIVTQRENANQKHLKSSSSFTGVYWNKNLKKWHAQIKVKSKHKHLGYFDNEEEASNAYQNYLINLKTN